MESKIDNHKIYDDDIKKAELGNKEVINKDTLSDQEAQLADKQSQASSGFTQYIDNAKVFFKKNPKKSAGLGFGMLGILSAVYLGVLSLGPLEVITLTENLKQTFFSEHEDASSNKINKLMFYAKSGGDHTTTRLGTLGNLYSIQIDKNLAKKGVFIKGSSGNKLTYVFDATKGDNPVSEKEAKKIAEEQHKAAQREGITTSRVEGHTLVIENEPGLFRTKYNKFVNKFVMKNTLEYGKVATALATRTENKRGGLGKWNVLARADGEINKKRSEVLKKLKDQLTGKRNTAQAEGTKAEDTDSEEQKKQSAETQTTANDGNGAKQDIKNGKSTASDYFKKSMKGLGLSGAGLGLVCMLKAGVDDVDGANRLTAKMNTIRAFQKVLPLGDEAKSGDLNTINYQGLGEIAQLLRVDPSYKKEAQEQELPVYETSSLQNYENTKYTNNIDTSGAKLPDEARQDLANSDIGNFLNAIPGLDGMCKVLSNTVVTILSSVTAPLTSAFTAVVTPIAMNTITNFFKDDAIDWTLERYRGGPFKEAIFAGGREYSNQVWYQDGGRPLTDSEIAIENNIAKEKYIAENKSKSIAQKYFNLYDSNSPANKVAISIQRTPLSGEPANIMSNFSQIFSAKLLGKAKAATEVNDTAMYYGTRKAKLTTNFQDKYEQPYETAEKASNILKGSDANKYKDLVKKCFGFEVVYGADDELDFKSINGTEDEPLLIDPDSKEYPNECKNDDDENLNLIRDALNSTNNMKRFVCAEFNDTDSCNEILPDDDKSDSTTSKEGAFIQGDYAWPVGIFKKDFGTPSMPCSTSPPYCHHDNSPAFDLSTKNTPDAENKPVYAITDGKMWLTKNHNGIENCYTFHILGDDGYDYFYGHVKNTILTDENDTKRVKKGDKIAEIGTLACGDNTINHLHIDQSKEYNHAVSSRTENLIKIMNDLYENLPDSAPESTGSQTTSSSGWQWPIRKSDFSGNITNCWRKPGHTGVDIGVGVGTSVYAAKAGTVVQSGDGGDAGNFVMIKHEGGNWSNYQHLSSIIKKSGSVEAGEIIGKSGNTGYSEGPHLHFSITDAQTLSSRYTGTNTLDPLNFLPKDGPGKISCN